MELLIFVSFVFFALWSILGFGKLFETFFFDSSVKINIGLTGFFGLFILSSIAYITHLFVPHNYIHNLILLFSGLISFTYFYRNSSLQISKIHYLIFFLLIIGVFLAKSHDDFGYYHLPNALHFSQNKIEFGLGNLNHGFKHHSSIFYLYSIFIFPFIEFYLINVLNFFFLLFAVIFLFDNIFNDIKIKQFDNSSLISVIFLILFISLFNRIGEYGADITGQLLAGIVIYISAKIILRDKVNTEYILIIISLLTYLITIKTYFVVYIFFPIVLMLYKKNKLIEYKDIFLSKIFFLSILIGIIFSIINISATGCIIFPIKNLCFPSLFSWGLNLETVSYMSSWYEIWSKAGAGPDFRVHDPLDYIKNFNWVNNWIDRYFFTKVSDFLLALFVVLSIIYLTFRDKFQVIYIYKIKKLIYFYTLILILFAIWFLKFPSLRYGGYTLVISLIIIPFSFLFNFKNMNYKKTKKSFYILFALAILVFFTRNITRLNKEFNYSAVENFNSFPFFYIKKTIYKEEIINNQKFYIISKSGCWATPTPCLKHTDIKITNRLSYRFYER